MGVCHKLWRTRLHVSLGQFAVRISPSCCIWRAGAVILRTAALCMNTRRTPACHIFFLRHCLPAAPHLLMVQDQFSPSSSYLFISLSHLAPLHLGHGHVRFEGGRKNIACLSSLQYHHCCTHCTPHRAFAEYKSFHCTPHALTIPD